MVKRQAENKERCRKGGKSLGSNPDERGSRHFKPPGNPRQKAAGQSSGTGDESAFATEGALDTHVTPVDVFFYVVSGRGSVEIGAEKAAVQAQDLVFSPQNVPHALQAAEDAPFEVLVVKTPNPAGAKRDN